MDNKDIFIIILILILIILFFAKNTENFDLLTLYPYKRCNLLSKDKYMIRDIRTKLWLMADGEYGKFIPGNFGVPLMFSEKPKEYLPLRLLGDPNTYLVASYDRKYIRAVPNPTSPVNKLEIYIYKDQNLIGFLDNGLVQNFIHVDDFGNIVSVVDPNVASPVEILTI